MAKPKGTHWVVTAAFTEDGAPAYRTPVGGWSRVIDEAALLESETDRDSSVNAALAEERVVCDPYAFQVVPENGKVNPLSARETIRATGPTTRLRRPDDVGYVSR
jgi:hypothetical protein